MFRRRIGRGASARPEAAPDAVPDDEGRRAGSAAVGDESVARRTASRLHTFNRYELKYLLPVEQVAVVRDELARRLEPDPHSPVGGYGVWSLYYDSRALRCYWEKIEGLKFRRKLRIRHYGEPSTVTDGCTVYVEVKQRVNRVTQKRRLVLPYPTARRLCDGRELIEHHPADRPLVHEVLDLLVRHDLRPTLITGYQREALVGHGPDTGVRVTFDRRIRGRDRDLHLGDDTAQNRFTVAPHLAVMEVKVNERTPFWITDLAGRRNLSLVRVSKYVQSVESYGLAPRSVFHVPDTEHAAGPAAHPETPSDLLPMEA